MVFVILGYMITIFFLLFIIQCSLSYYLTGYQRKQIGKILQSPEISYEHKQLVKNKLISKYSWWAIGKATLFQKKYNINPNYAMSSEFIQSGLLGLCKSMKDYDGRVDVPYYAKWFVYHELYSCFTRCHPFGMSSHYQMMHLKYKRSERDKITPFSRDNYNGNCLNNDVSSNHIGQVNKHTLLSGLNELSPKDKRVFCLRYDIDTLNTKRTYKDISAIMHCSVSTVGHSTQRSWAKIKQTPFDL